MSDTNIYAAPESDLRLDITAEPFDLHPPRTVTAGRGAQWLNEGFELFKQAPGVWIGIIVVGFVIMVALSLIPFVGILMGLTTYIWMGGLMLGCKALHDGQPLQFSHLFAGFSNSFGPLLGLSVVITLAWWLLGAVVFGTAFLLMPQGGQLFNPAEAMGLEGLRQLGLATLIFVALLLPLTMCSWFAPALIVINKVPVFKAMAMSFNGCLKNMVPFLIYGVLAMVMLVLAMLPLGLGVLVVGPLLYGSIFCAYKDVYVD